MVEPREGYPTKLDREYLVVQSEFYAKPEADGRNVDGAPLYVLDIERLNAAQPTHTVFNGSHDGMVKKPLAAKPGERVRLLVLNVGPSKTAGSLLVDHHFANASQGAIGLISTQDKSWESELAHHNIETSNTPTEPAAAAGKLAFESKCLTCHSVGQGKKLGLDTAGVSKLRTDAWLT